MVGLDATNISVLPAPKTIMQNLTVSTTTTTTLTFPTTVNAALIIDRFLQHCYYDYYSYYSRRGWLSRIVHPRIHPFFLGIFFVLPCIESYQKVDLRTITLGVPPQEVRQTIRLIFSYLVAARILVVFAMTSFHHYLLPFNSFVLYLLNILVRTWLNFCFFHFFPLLVVQLQKNLLFTTIYCSLLYLFLDLTVLLLYYWPLIKTAELQ